VDSPSPEDRALLDTAGIELYEAIVEEGAIRADDPRIMPGAETHAAFRLLQSLGLVHRDPDDTTQWVPEDPNAAQSRIVAPLSAEGSRLLEESTSWSRTFSTMAQAWRRAPQGGNRGPFLYLRGQAAIGSYITALVADVDQEILTAQPQAGRDTRGLRESIRMETELLSGGVSLRTLYQHSARRSVATREYVAALSKLGAQVRTVDEFFNRMIVADRRAAIIPSPEDLGVALAIREPTIVAYLVDVFERSWSRARPFTSTDASVTNAIAAEQRSMTMRMLIEGHPDAASAKRLGVSPRTYAGYVSDLKEEFDVETRFQLGYTIGRLGFSGDEGDGPVGPAADPRQK